VSSLCWMTNWIIFISCVECNVILLKSDAAVTKPVSTCCIWTGLRYLPNKPRNPHWTVHYHSPMQYRSLRGKNVYFFIFNYRILTFVQGRQSCWPPLPLPVIDIKGPAHTLSLFYPIVITKHPKNCVFSSFRREVDGKCVLLGDCAECSGQNCLFGSEFLTVTLCILCRFSYTSWNAAL